MLIRYYAEQSTYFQSLHILFSLMKLQYIKAFANVVSNVTSFGQNLGRLSQLKGQIMVSYFTGTVNVQNLLSN